MSGRLPKRPGAFWDDVLVECPRCGGMAHVLWGRSADSRLVCGACGHAAAKTTREWGRYEAYRQGQDPVFGLPLWLREPVGREVVWAYNWPHFEDLRFFLEGDWRTGRGGRSPRTGGPLSYRNDLPRWMHLKANRAALLRAMARIRRRRWRVG